MMGIITKQKYIPIIYITLIILTILITMFLSIYSYNLLAHPTIQETSNITPPVTLQTTQVITYTPTQTLPVITPAVTQIPVNTIKTGVIPKSFNYTLQGNTNNINMNLYSDVYSNVLNETAPVECWRYTWDKTPCNTSESQQYYLQYINNPAQAQYLSELTNSIKSKTNNREDQVRIAISLVQKIPYGSTSSKFVSPYEVLYTNKGVCSEKSILLAYLLKNLGYGVVLFKFTPENHMAVGIKSPLQYSYKNSGYAFIETTTPVIPTDSQEDYGGGQLVSDPIIINISDGDSFSGISQEYSDVITYNGLKQEGNSLSPAEYRKWEVLVWKYGLLFENGSTILQDPSYSSLCNGGEFCNNQCWAACPAHETWSCTPQGGVCQ